MTVHWNAVIEQEVQRRRGRLSWRPLCREVGGIELGKLRPGRRMGVVFANPIGQMGDEAVSLAWVMPPLQARPKT